MRPFPAPSFDTVPIEIAGRTFTFRRLTWKDEIEFGRRRQNHDRAHLLAFALTHVGGKAVRLEDAEQIISALPRPIRERLVVLYKGSLPDHRLVEVVKMPLIAPEPSLVQARIIDEDESEDEKGDRILERQFGADEVAYAREQEQAIALAGMHGATKAMVPDTDSESSIDDSDEPAPRSGKYHVVM